MWYNSLTTAGTATPITVPVEVSVSLRQAGNEFRKALQTARIGRPAVNRELAIATL